MDDRPCELYDCGPNSRAKGKVLRGQGATNGARALFLPNTVRLGEMGRYGVEIPPYMTTKAGYSERAPWQRATADVRKGGAGTRRYGENPFLLYVEQGEAS